MSGLVTSHKSTPMFQSPSPPSQTTFYAANGRTVRPDRLGRPNQPHASVMPQHQFGVPTTGNGAFAPQFHFHPQQTQPRAQPTFAPVQPRYELFIPESPAKSRVETQITLKLILTPPPPGITKLHLPTQAISKPKLQAKPTPARSANMLELTVSVVCTSAMQQPEMKERALQRALNNPPRHLPPKNDEDENSPQKGAEVRICPGCMTRERKRAARKRVKNQDDEDAWLQDQDHRVIVFNTQEVKDWESSGELDTFPGSLKVELPLRIACYCRHHSEKMGFNIIFTLKDHQLRPVAQCMSRPIMITDDHKTHPMASLTTQTEAPMDVNSFIPPASAAAPSQLPPQHGQELTNGTTPKAPTPVRTPPATNGSGRASRTLSRPASPSQGGPAKKRKSSSSASRVPNSLAMTKMETTSPSASQTSQQPGATSPFNANASNFGPDPMFSQANGNPQFGNHPQTPGTNEQPPLFAGNRSASMDNFAMPPQLYSAPPSSHPSRAPSPNSIMNNMHTTQNNISQAVANGVLSMPMGGGPGAPTPVINKIIPSEGPKVGGVEVTLLGREFWNGMTVYFGTQKAQTTTFWSDCSVVCLLPPSPVTGVVPVACDRPHNLQVMDWSNPPALFKYIDDSENQIMRLALACIGGKMNGKDLDISQVARQVLEKHLAGNGQAGEQPSGGAPMFNRASANEGLETQLLKCLDVIDLDDSPYQADLDRKGSTGHTMLHLACSLGYRRFVAALLARGANPNELDHGHCTPLHLAAMHDQPEIARRLMLAGANPNIRSFSGVTALDVSESGAVTRAIRFSEPRGRSQSGELSHSRTSSASSLRSLWEPMSMVNTNDSQAAIDDGEESPEYTSGDFEDEDPDEDIYLQMRRPSMLRKDQDKDLDPNSSPPNALAAALKDQIQQQLNQFQQSMALHLQNLPHLPQMPQIPILPGMPFADYQAYLQQAPFMRRMTQYMPGMSGSRPETQDGADTKMDHRWWDLSSFMSSNPAPPPSYEEIFPQKDMDTKQASAAQAAAEAEADSKCASLYDQESTLTEPASKTEVPSVLKIGRKNAITREQQEQFLRAREEKLKRLGNDRNLFFIWIPLLILMVCAMLYSYFPSLFILVGSFVWTMMRSAGRAATNAFSHSQNRPERVEL